MIYNPYYKNSGYPTQPNYVNPTGSMSTQTGWSTPTKESNPETAARPHEKYHAVKEEIVYVEGEPVKNSTRQDYELYLMEKEYYTPQSSHHPIEKDRNHCPEDMYKNPHQHMGKEHANKEDVHKHLAMDPSAKITCENLPLATAYVRSQPFQNLNSPAETLHQGTLFNDLYQPYVARKVAQGGRR